MSAEAAARLSLSQATSPPLVPWSVRDSWLGVGLAILIDITAIAVAVWLSLSNAGLASLLHNSAYLQLTGASLLELVYVVPVIAILAWRHADWHTLGFRSFAGSTLGLGCGLLIPTYAVVMVYGSVLVMLKIQTQGDAIMEIVKAAKSPAGLVIAAVIAAPFAEEIFFRGFLFQGLLQKQGWKKAALLSSLIFAAVHFQWAALLPTFLLGCLFSFLYHKSNSIWPEIILHFLVNSFAMCMVVASLQLSALPSAFQSFVISLTWLS